MFALFFVLVVALVTVTGAELVRSSCRRLLEPVPHRAASQLAGVE